MNRLSNVFCFYCYKIVCTNSYLNYTAHHISFLTRFRFTPLKQIKIKFIHILNILCTLYKQILVCYLLIKISCKRLINFSQYCFNNKINKMNKMNKMAVIKHRQVPSLKCMELLSSNLTCAPNNSCQSPC